MVYDFIENANEYVWDLCLSHFISSNVINLRQNTPQTFTRSKVNQVKCYTVSLFTFKNIQ